MKKALLIHNSPNLTTLSRSSWKTLQVEMARITPSKAKQLVIYKDDDIIAINKPSGLSVQGSSKDLVSQLGYWQFDSPRPPGLGHRLDKNTTGVLLLTRNSASAQRLRELFESKKIVKKYWAITINVPKKEKGSLTIPLSTKNFATKSLKPLHRVILRSDKAEYFSKEKAGSTIYGSLCMAWTDYKVLSRNGTNASLVDIDLKTGFKHQIRAHLADGLNCPILGDYLFAGPLFRKDSSLVRKMHFIGNQNGYTRGPVYLHAYEVHIPRKGCDPIIIKAPLPHYFVKTLKALQLKIPKHYNELAKL